MDIINHLLDLFEVTQETQTFFTKFVIQLGIFILFIFLSIAAGKYTPILVKLIISRLSTDPLSQFYEKIIEPIENLFKLTGTLILISISLEFLQNYPGLYNFLKLSFDLLVIGSVAWLASSLFRQVVRIYGINLIQKLGREVDELFLIVETMVNVIIGFVAAVTFAQRLSINLVGLLASLGLGGLAIAFAAQKTLEQLLGTFVLYLDRPFIVGEYIRLNNGLFGRVESIGLRSTKIRTAAKSTLMIIPNSMMANIEVENVTRGKKVMVLLYLDFEKNLEDREKALVEQVVKESTNVLFGIDPDSTKIALFLPENKPNTRARVTFFILGSSENSLSLRKRLLELANDNISKQLSQYEINFVMQDPTIYIDSPVTI
jgi:small-conductance mechanosensitive channel